MKNKATLYLIFLIIFFTAKVFAGQDLFIQNVKLIDGTGTGALIQEDVSVLILNGRIAEIGRNIERQGIKNLDANGSYLLPGLFDAHVHLMWGPGVLINDYQTPTNLNEWNDTWGKNILNYLKAYLACGVTTVLDASAPVFVIKDIQDILKNGHPGPRFLNLGQFFSPPKGYAVSAMNKPVATPEEVEEKMDLMLSIGAIGIKIPIEKGFNPISDLPKHSPEILNAIKQGAKKRNLPIYLHATTEEDFNAGLDLGVHAFMHTLANRFSMQLSESFIDRMADKDVYQVTTLSIMDSELTQYDLDRLIDPLLKIVVPDSELKTAKNPENGKKSYKINMKKTFPWLPSFLAGMLANSFFNEKNIKESLQNSKKAINDLHNAGVTIVMGTDTVYQRLSIYNFHGISSLSTAPQK